MIKLLLIGLITLLSFASYGQSFEGYITYRTELLNPNPKMMNDSTWQGINEKHAQGIQNTFQKHFYKKGNYMIEIQLGQEKSFNTYNPKDGLLYCWREKSDTATTINTKKNNHELIEIIYSDETDTVSGVYCKSIVLKSKMVQKTIWYNSEYFKMDAKYYKGHKYGQKEQFLNEIGCLPLKIELKNFFSHVVLTAVEFNETSIDEKRFEIPEFRKVMKSPLD